MQIFSYTSVLSYVLGAQKNRLIETVLLSTHNICFGWEIRTFIFWYTLLSKVLDEKRWKKLIWQFPKLIAKLIKYVNAVTEMYTQKGKDYDWWYPISQIKLTECL